MPESIPMDANTKAFYMGVVAADSANQQLEELATEEFDLQLAYFWLTVGIQLAGDLPGADNDTMQLCIRGAALRQPTRPKPAFELVIDTFANAAFHTDGYDPDGEDVDDLAEENAVTAEVSRVLRKAASRVGCGDTQGELPDANGNSVGRFKLDVGQV